MTQSSTFALTSIENSLVPTSEGAAPAIAQERTSPPSLADLIAQVQSGPAEVAAQARVELEVFVIKNPDNPVAQLGWGIALALQGDFDRSRPHFEKAVALDAKFASGWSNLGNIYKLQGNLKEARAAYQKAIALLPDLPDAHYNLALVLDAQGHAEAAEESLRRALLFRPGYAEAHNNLGHMRLKEGKVEQALSHFRQALVFQPAMRQARDNLIFALYRLGRSAEAQSEVDRLLSAHPDDTHVLRVQAAGLAQMGHMESAAAINRKLMEIEPEAADLQFNMAEIMLSANDFEGAMACYRELLGQRRVQPAIAIGAMANVMHVQGNYAEARNLYQQALVLAPQAIPLVLGLGRVLLDSGETRLGLETLRRTLQLKPGAADVHSMLIYSMRMDATASLAQRNVEIAQWCKQHSPKIRPAQPHPRALKATDSLRIAFLTGDLERGPEAATLHILLNALPKADYDVFIYHAAHMGAAAKALQDKAVHWRPVAALGNADLAEQIRQDGIDIVLDLIGHGPGARLQGLLELPAHLQVSWLGDWAPTQVPAMNARLSDAVLDPGIDVVDGVGGNQAKVVRLAAPFYWCAPDSAPDLNSAKGDTPGAFTFGVVSPLSHISAPSLDAWGEILQAVPDARLVLLTDMAPADEATRERMLRLFRLREIDTDRVDILPRMPSEERMMAMSKLDVVLDTFPKPLGFYALDALWMGVAVLTLAGEESWQRSTASVLTQAGLGDWVLPSRAGYIARAVAASGEPDFLSKLRMQLRHRLKASPMMDPVVFAASFVAAMETLCPRRIAAAPAADTAA